MKLWKRVASRVSPEFYWRCTCPGTIESIADDFINNHLLPLKGIRSLDFSKIDDGDPWFAWRRRISAIYGVATTYRDPRGKSPKPGWNRRLWRNTPDLAPEQLVERIFDTAIARLRATLA
jgi:hypothetical protein